MKTSCPYQPRALTLLCFRLIRCNLLPCVHLGNPTRRLLQCHHLRRSLAASFDASLVKLRRYLLGHVPSLPMRLLHEALLKRSIFEITNKVVVPLRVACARTSPSGATCTLWSPLRRRWIVGRRWL